MKNKILQQFSQGTAKTALAVLAMGFLAHSVEAQAQTLVRGEQSSRELKPILADIEMLEKIGAVIEARQVETGVGFARVSPAQEAELSRLSHEKGRCGGFEALPDSNLDARSPLLTHAFGQLAEQEARNRRFVPSTAHFRSLRQNATIEKAVSEVSEANLRATVELLSNYESRVHTASNPNVHVEALKTRLEEMLKSSSLPTQIDLISHSSTRQKSLRVRLTGSKRPSEIVVLGGHLDSINQSWFGGGRNAPGADDNASGSANLVEALRILLTQAQPERTIEIFWYAGEEGGLLGSAEIARSYKSENKDVIAALQLDMTLFPGEGEFVLGSMTDFTSAWFRSYFETLNGYYIKARIVEDKCGYGCSDHASWHKQGYPALMPFEATFNRMNHNIHTAKDIIDSNSSFRHSAMFSKIAVAIAMDLGNSTLRQP